ncbi:MAG: YbaN family protein [Candidatus Izemoplasma sp.]
MKKTLFIILGLLMLTIGAVGVVLPGLPTTIFLILAAYFFTHSSPKLYNWLMSNKTFGPIISNYTKYRGITSKDRRNAIITIWIVIIVSIIFAQNIWLIALLIAVAILHTIFLFRLNLLST